MEDLETQERLLSLGKKLIDSFNGSEGDQTSEWMSQFIAEKIVAIASAKGKAKLSAQMECFDAILVLWKHQAYFPNHLKPFENFDKIFSALAHINPDSDSPSFFRNENNNKPLPEEIEQHIKFITHLDAATRIMISFFVREAVLSAANESTIEWINAIKGIDESNEIRVILRVLPEFDVKELDEVQSKKEQRVKKLSEYIERLDAFESISQYVRSTLQTELEGLRSE